MMELLTKLELDSRYVTTLYCLTCVKQSLIWLTHIKLPYVKGTVLTEAVYLLEDQLQTLLNEQTNERLQEIQRKQLRLIDGILQEYVNKNDFRQTTDALKQTSVLEYEMHMVETQLLYSIFTIFNYFVRLTLTKSFSSLQILYIVMFFAQYCRDMVNDVKLVDNINAEIMAQSRNRQQLVYDLLTNYQTISQTLNANGQFDDERYKHSICNSVDYMFANKRNTNESSVMSIRNKRIIRDFQRRFKLLTFLVYDENELNDGHVLSAFVDICAMAKSLYFQINSLESVVNQLESRSTVIPPNTPIRTLNVKNKTLFSIGSFEFKYNEKVVLQNKGDKIAIKSGQWVQVAGNSGAGKTTLFRLLTRYSYADNFAMFGDKQYSYKDARRYIVNVKQGDGLFSGTVLRNVTYSIGAAHDKLLKEYFTFLRLGDYETVKEKHINQLSSGEQQRVKMIRAFILMRTNRDKRVYFFDEATSNMDAEMEKIVLDELKRLQAKHKLTVMFVSHNKNVTQYADKHLVIGENGIIT
jgi:ABC-type multidrug transport system fused ATPase/permease subunit